MKQRESSNMPRVIQLEKGELEIWDRQLDSGAVPSIVMGALPQFYQVGIHPQTLEPPLPQIQLTEQKFNHSLFHNLWCLKTNHPANQLTNSESRGPYPPLAVNQDLLEVEYGRVMLLKKLPWWHVHLAMIDNIGRGGVEWNSRKPCISIQESTE